MRNPLFIEQKIYRERARRKKWKAHYNYVRNLEKKSEVKKTKRKGNRSQRVVIPKVFSLYSDRNGVLDFFHSLQTIREKDGRFLYFDFSAVTDISHGAITILLSYIGWLNDQGFYASGNYPEDKSSKQKFERSGFLNFFKTIGTRKYEQSENTIVAIGETKTDSELTAKLIRKSTKTIWGVEDKNMKVQGILIELMANTINHAYFSKNYQKGWYFSIDHISEENKVRFCFVDNGVGILKTINQKFHDKISKFFRNESSNRIIERAFDGEFGSRTRRSNRGRGLKAIKKVFEQGYIKSLKVITNNVFYDFDKKSIEELKRTFDGTFYFWEIDKSCKR